jgi:tetratricopeptide (TPR) repeat protein
VKRISLLLLVVIVLLAGTIVAERALQKVERVDPLGRKLLYLPSAEMLELVSLGNQGLLADALYLWSIQYYSKYQLHEQFLYLETVYELITDLDPLYQDAYRIGALIMQLPTTDVETHKTAVICLYDKALRNMPDNYEIAEAAGWDMYVRYRDKPEALRYFRSAAAVPGSPHRIKRFLAVWSNDEEGWSFEDALEYWMEVRGEAETDYDVAVCEKQIYRLHASRDEAALDSVLQNWKLRHGICANNWQEVVRAGWLREVPVDYFGKDYRISPDTCTAQAVEGVRFD